MKTCTKLLLLLVFVLNIQASKAAILPILPGPVNQGEITMADHNHFPELKSKNLEGKEYLLPQDLETELSILVLAYKRDQQKDVDAWLSGIKEKEIDICPVIRSYEVPVLKQFNTFIRFNIDNGMRYGIDDKSKREHVLSVYVDKESFNQALEIASEETVHTLLVRQSGEILWKESGTVDDEKLNELKDFLKFLLKGKK
ncbi:MAG: hypothetical protein MK033_04155 [Candidatus Caenarcaniphilales bacterium]|nr:hypothetical protein [Candidatus Caenarcaniphilales bacterium]